MALKWPLCRSVVPWCLVTENIQPKVTTTSLADLVEAFLGLVTYLLCTRAALSWLLWIYMHKSSRNIIAAFPLFLLIQWKEAGSEATGKASRQKDTQMTTVCTESLLDDWLHKMFGFTDWFTLPQDYFTSKNNA